MAATALSRSETAVKNLFSILFFNSDARISNNGLIFINNHGHRTLVRIVNRIEDKIVKDGCPEHLVKCLLRRILQFDRKL